MENIIDIYNLLPEEIDKMIKNLTNALEVIKHRKNTNSKFVDNEKEEIVCPCCKSNKIIKNGHDKNKVQTYYCKSCTKRFSSCTSIPISHAKLTYEQLWSFLTA